MVVCLHFSWNKLLNSTLFILSPGLKPFTVWNAIGCILYIEETDIPKSVEAAKIKDNLQTVKYPKTLILFFYLL